MSENQECGKVAQFAEGNKRRSLGDGKSAYYFEE
jgi:hypothetical protein